MLVSSAWTHYRIALLFFLSFLLLQLSRRQAARELSEGRSGVCSREQLQRRLRELQREKARKGRNDYPPEEEHKYQANGPPHPLSPVRPSSAGGATTGPSVSLEWSERLRQAKAKYWSSLDQMAPDWKANAQQRRLEQLAKYEQAIGQNNWIRK